METTSLLSFNQQRAFWVKHLQAGASVLELPKRRLHRAEHNNEISVISTVFPTEVRTQFQTLLRTHSVPAEAPLLALVRSLLYRYTRQSAVVLNLLVASEDESETGNAIALRQAMNGEEHFSDLLTHYADTLERVSDYRNFAFADLQEALIAKTAINPVAIQEVALHYYQPNNASEPGLAEVGDWPEQFGLTFSFVEQADRLRLRVHYRSSLYTEATVRRLVENLENFFRQVLTEPTAPVQSLQYLSAAQQRELLLDLNQTERPFPEDQSIVGLFEEQVRLKPAAAALIVKDQLISYDRLNERANRLARFLIDRHDVQSGDLVGVKTERDESLLVALLAVMKTGAAYVPIDPAYPAERIEYIERDSQCKLTIDQALLVRFREAELDYDKDNLDFRVPAQNTAYVIYTSGSTGNPKGVVINHRSAVAMITWALEEFSDQHFELTYAVTSHCFDLSIYEFFFSLAAGKTVRLIQSALHLQDYLEHDRRVLINTVPSVVKQLLDEEVDLSNVRVLNMAGEPIPVNTIRQLDKARIAVRNLYGPSEDTTYSSCYRFEDRKYTQVPIGKPIYNTRFYLLDEHLQLVPKGCIGELFISGVGLAQGYLGKRELTEEKFVPNPFVPNARLYRTGDLARYAEDGNLEFLGRQDKQVKLRGFRIELGEIEDQLIQQKEWVRAAVVQIREVQREPQLIAYVVPTGAELAEEKIKRAIQQFLPHFMLPNFYVALPAIPLPPNGKTDTRALPDVDLSLIASKNYVAPRTDLERELVALWEKLLRAERVGIADSFFERGGNSLMAVKMINKINKQYRVSMSVEYFFDAETIQHISGLIQLQIQEQRTENEEENENVEELTL